MLRVRPVRRHEGIPSFTVSAAGLLRLPRVSLAMTRSLPLFGCPGRGLFELSRDGWRPNAKQKSEESRQDSSLLLPYQRSHRWVSPGYP